MTTSTLEQLCLHLPVVGCILGIQTWVCQQLQIAVPAVECTTRTALIEQVKELTQKVTTPTVRVIGALGNCGAGAVECAVALGVEVVLWDTTETKGGGPFQEIVDGMDIVVNCILLIS